MSIKTKRLLAIKKIISSTKVCTQEELINILLKKGFDLTQATLSRDLKTLRVGKMADREKGSIYFLNEEINQSAKESNNSTDRFPLSGVLGLNFSGNFAVIKTKSGYASSIATLIDSGSTFEILGTIAGDDTILIIPADGVGRTDLLNAMIVLMPELEGRI